MLIDRALVSGHVDHQGGERYRLQDSVIVVSVDLAPEARALERIHILRGANIGAPRN